MSDATSAAPQRPPHAMRMPPHMRGRSLIDGPIAPALILFSLPLLGSNILQSLSMTVNAIWVSHVLGEAALTATVNSQILMMLLMGAVMGVGMAANIVLAQAFGAGNDDMVKKIVGTALGFFAVSSVVLGIAGVLLAPMILDMMRTPEDARIQAIIYLRYTCLSMPLVFSFMFTQMLMRAAGDSRTPFTYSLVAILLGFIFTPFLLTGWFGTPQLGIAGAVVGNIAAQAIALVLLYRAIYRKHSPIALRGPELRYLVPNLDILKVLVLRGMPMGIQMFVMSAASIVMLAMVNAYGSSTAAGYGAATQLWSYVQMPAMALAASVSSMAAQNVGAGRWDRVNQIAGISVGIGLAITGGVVALLYLLGDLPLMLFLPAGSESLRTAVSINHYVLWGWIPFAITFVLFGIVRANGAIIPPTIILCLALWLIRVPFAQYLQPIIGIEAIWWSFPLGTIISAAGAFAYYRWGGWRKNKLMMASFGAVSPAAAHPEAASETPDGATAVQPMEALAPAILKNDADEIAALRRDIDAMRARHNLADATE